MIAKRFRPSIGEIGPLIEEVIKNGKDIKLTVTGNSMYPLFRSGKDDVVLEKCTDFKKYDVVLFKRKNGQYVFHRILKIEGDILSIAGDNEIEMEYPVLKSDCVAKLKSFERFGKKYTVNALWYKIYVRFWHLIFPLRRKVIKLIVAFAVRKRKIKNKLSGGD